MLTNALYFLTVILLRPTYRNRKCVKLKRQLIDYKSVVVKMCRPNTPNLEPPVPGGVTGNPGFFGQSDELN